MITDYYLRIIQAKKLSVFEPKVSKILNWAQKIEKLLAFNVDSVTYLQYFCRRKVKECKKDCLTVIQTNIYND